MHQKLNYCYMVSHSETLQLAQHVVSKPVQANCKMFHRCYENV